MVPQEEIQRQYALMEKICVQFGGGKYHIETYGCQMNVRDSQTLAGMLEKMGYDKAEDIDHADLILFNTCCVRDNAERRVFGNVGHLAAAKKQNPKMVIGVCGCMMQQEDVAKKLMHQARFVDLVFGTGNQQLFPEILYKVLTQRERTLCLSTDAKGAIAEGLPAHRDSEIQAFVNIMYGCNNFCTYCIVPYVRGRERSRAPESILKEVEELAGKGVKEIMLLGQNVNSYKPDDGMTFAQLLQRLNGIVPRIRFMTSHPKDLSDELIDVMAQGGSLCPQLHLPVQSGSTRILQEMNRRYTAQQYLALVKKIRAAIPHISITTDFIVGFPGETEEDFLQTLQLDAEAQFNAAFTFVYSPRQGTKAAAMAEQIPEDVKKERIQRLIRQQESITAQKLLAYQGTQQEILIEGISKRDEDAYFGRTPGGQTVNLLTPVNGGISIGDIIKVKITSIAANTLQGEPI